MNGMDVRASLARAIRPRSVESEVAALYRAHFRYVWQVLRKLGVDPASLEDAAHDVFVVAHRRWHDFEGRSTARTWLFAIARRIAFRYRRTWNRSQRRRAALALVRPPEPVEPDAMVACKEAWHALISFLDELPREHREAFVLGELEGVGRQQMGLALGINPNTAYSRLRAARSRFVEVFPEPDRRHAVASAEVPPPREAKRRVWALVAAHPVVAAGRPLPLAGVLQPASIAMALGGGLVLALKVAVGSATPSAPRAREPVAIVAGTELDGPDASGRGAAALEPMAAPDPVIAAVAHGSTEPTEPPPSPVRAETRASPPAPPSATTTVAPGREPPAMLDLSAAMASLTEARRVLAQGQPVAALEHLERSRRFDPEDVFATERSVTRVWSLCAAQRPAQARREMHQLLQRGSSSAYVAVLSESCVADMITRSASGGDERG